MGLSSQKCILLYQRTRPEFTSQLMPVISASRDSMFPSGIFCGHTHTDTLPPTSLVPVLRRQRQADLCEYEASLVYMKVQRQPGL